MPVVKAPRLLHGCGERDLKEGLRRASGTGTLVVELVDREPAKMRKRSKGLVRL